MTNPLKIEVIYEDGDADRPFVAEVHDTDEDDAHDAARKLFRKAHPGAQIVRSQIIGGSVSAALNDPGFWPKVADTIGSNHHYTYDLGDRSHLLDVVQIVCEAASKLVADPTHDQVAHAFISGLVHGSEFPQDAGDSDTMGDLARHYIATIERVI